MPSERPPRRPRTPALLLALTPLLGFSACQDDAPDLSPASPPTAVTDIDQVAPVPEDQGPSFVSVPRKDADQPGGDVALVRQMLSSGPAKVFDPGDSFYLAVHRRELGKRWFLSAYLRQFFPDEVNGGAAQTLGTRVVSFRVQNGKLYLFDVDDRKQTSDSFGGDHTLVDAYPIVDPASVVASAAQVRALRDYVLVDPGAGMNRFGVVADAFASGALGAEKPFQVELKFSQRFRALADGVSFEQAFTGYSERPRYKDLSVPGFQEQAERVEPNLFRSSGVLGLSLRRYQEGEGFVPLTTPFHSRYFTGPPRLVPNTGTQELTAAKWNLRPDLPPVEWIISPLVLEIQARADSQAANLDLVAAIKRGIESWNQAFGFTALTARLAEPDESMSDDEKNYFIYDENPTIGGAFANWRSNPNTGEIRGASVYFNDGFRSGALQAFHPDTGWIGGAGSPAERPAKRPALTWQPFPAQQLCALEHGKTIDRAQLPEGPLAASYKENVEKYISFIVAHEIGHTLGLRHNFKGSLLPPTSSVMDYLGASVILDGEMPASYDVAAIRFLYGLSEELPAQPFCNDADVGNDPSCQRFDRGADPLREYYGRFYPLLVQAFLDTGDFDAAVGALDFVLPLGDFMRMGRTLADRTLAFEALWKPISATAGPGPARPPGYVDRLNLFAPTTMFFLFPDPSLPEEERFPIGPPLHPAIEELVAGELRGNVLNQDGQRYFATRRLAVDTLKHIQGLAAYQALRSARTVLAAPSEIPPPPAEQALLEDLLARVTAAVSPYFTE